jgi:hypothetical protein
MEDYEVVAAVQVELHPTVISLRNDVQRLETALQSARGMCELLQAHAMRDMLKRRRRQRKKKMIDPK